MTALFDRDWRLQVGELVVEKPLRVAFTLQRSIRSQPNTGTIRVFNLTRSSQAIIGEAREAAVKLEAGFVDGRSQIFLGQVARARTNQSPPVITARDALEVVSTIEVVDSGPNYRRARVCQTFQTDVSVLTVLRACVDALGVGEGNLSEVEAFAELEGGQTVYPEGTVLAGQASRELARILRSYGLRYSIQHGAIQVSQRRRALQTQAVRLATATGLVGTPEVGTGGRVTAISLLTPELWPGRRVVLESERIEGQFLVRSITYEGDSHGDPWYATLELRPEETAAA